MPDRVRANLRGRADDRAIAWAIERWFAAHARDLPWRTRRSAYRALVAEAMLQQTQVHRVAPRFEAFLRRFPTVKALASATEDDVLAAWQGLGYYRRARSLHAAAVAIECDFGGRVPRKATELALLPGVGRYTAGAVASIACGERVPIVDGNVYRVLARLSACAEGPDDRASMAWAWTRAESLVEAASSPGALNEGLMELGATVCTPRAPRCAACPIAGLCEARRRGLEDSIPPARRGAARAVIHHHAVIVVRGGRVLLEQRPRRGLWAGLWQTPTVESTRPLAESEIEALVGVPLSSALEQVGRFEYLTTHRRVAFAVFHARSRARRGVWRDPRETADLAMSSAHRRVLGMIAWGGREPLTLPLPAMRGEVASNASR